MKTDLEILQQRMLEIYRHEMSGLFLEAVMEKKTGAELSIYIRSHLRKMDQRILDMVEAQHEMYEKPVIQKGK